MDFFWLSLGECTVVRRKFILIFSLVLALFSTVWADTTGNTICGTGSEPGTTWSNESNLTADDNAYATNSTSSVGVVVGSNYGFSIAAGSTIDSIIVTMEHRLSGGGSPANRDGFYGVSKDGTTFANDSDAYVGLNNVNVTEVSNGVTDRLWGTTWTVTEANAIKTLSHRQAGSSQGTHQIDYHQVNIWFTTAGGAPDVSARRRRVLGQ